MIKGYKAFREGLVTQFDTTLEEGVIYRITDQIKYNKNGYHFCTYPEDTFRYTMDFPEETILTEVSTNGEVRTNDDEYNGYYDLYVTNEIRVDKVFAREEMFNLILSRGNEAIDRMVRTLLLNEEELNRLRGKSYMIDNSIKYYQDSGLLLKLKKHQ